MIRRARRGIVSLRSRLRPEARSCAAKCRTADPTCRRRDEVYPSRRYSRELFALCSPRNSPSAETRRRLRLIRPELHASGNPVEWVLLVANSLPPLQITQAALLEMIVESLDFHFSVENLFVRSRFPHDVARCTIDLRQGVERHQRRILHQDTPRLVQQRDALFRIAGPLLLVDELVEFGILVLNPWADAGTKILVVNGIGVGGG